MPISKSPFQEFQDEIQGFIKNFKRPYVPFYRGVNDGSYELVPSLFRNQDKWKEKFSITTLENNLYYDFCAYGDGILDSKEDWNILYKMQHHGIPTRILDWSESFGVALYFALLFSDKINNPAIWVLDPYQLNDLVSKKNGFTERDYSTLYNPNSDFKKSYFDYFIVGYKKEKKNIFKTPQALYPIKSNSRIRAQWGVFTIHGKDDRCLNKQLKNDKILRKFTIPNEAIEEAHFFLKNASINHFSMMPDFSGLEKHLKEFYYNK
jgi:hypothetical protein